MGGMTTTERVAVLGTGAIGSAVARRLLAAGIETTVWNRTPERTGPLVAAGARLASSPAAAVGDAGLALLTLTDYAAVAELLTEFDKGTVVAMCTGSPGGARTAADLAAERGLDFLAAGNQATPENIGTSEATILYGGARTVFDRHLPTLRLLGRPRFAGNTPEAAAVWDLALFGVWYDAQLGLLRALETARAAGIDLAEFAEAAGPSIGHVVTAASATAAELAAASFPAGPADLPEHLGVLRHLIELRAANPLGDGGLTPVIARVEALIADGRHGDGLNAVLS
jgi:3-hydroxyisobutyrate dehydrogenase-like beta-hydroxyacid dehydrogenase